MKYYFRGTGASILRKNYSLLTGDSLCKRLQTIRGVKAANWFVAGGRSTWEIEFDSDDDMLLFVLANAIKLEKTI